MTTKAQKVLAIASMALHFSFPLLAADQFYTVKPGDIFSRIARKHFGKPTYSEIGAVEKLRSLNPEIKDVHQLVSGQKLRVSDVATDTDVSEVPVVRPPLIVVKEAGGEFSPTYRQVHLKTVEKSSSSKTDIHSRYYVEIPATFEQKYHSKMSLYERISFASAVFSNPHGDSSHDQKFFLWGAGIGVKYIDLHRFDIFGEFGFDPMLYAKDVTHTDFKMVAMNLPNAKLGMQRAFIDYDHLSFGAHAHVATYFAGSDPFFTVKSGTGFGGGLFLRQAYSTSAWGLDVGVDQIYQNTSLFQQTRTDLKGSLKYELKFF